MVSLVTLIGLMAALCTTISYIPQLKKCWETGSTEDISLKMFLILAAGIALWVVYGVLKGDVVIVLANGVSLLLLSGILFFKLREMVGGRIFQKKPVPDAIQDGHRLSAEDATKYPHRFRFNRIRKRSHRRRSVPTGDAR